MPIIASAKKRVRVAAKATARNQQVKRRVRAAMKTFQAAVDSGKSADINTARSAAESAIDTAAKKKIIHGNKAARKKAQLARAAKEAGAKIGAPAKKAATTKSASKTTAKPAVKKAKAKAPATKKPASKK